MHFNCWTHYLPLIELQSCALCMWAIYVICFLRSMVLLLLCMLSILFLHWFLPDKNRPTTIYANDMLHMCLFLLVCMELCFHLKLYCILILLPWHEIITPYLPLRVWIVSSVLRFKFINVKSLVGDHQPLQSEQEEDC